MKTTFTVLVLFAVALVSACDNASVIAAKDSFVDPDIGFESMVRTLREDQANWQRAVGMRFKKIERHGDSSFLGRFDYVLTPAERNTNPLPPDAFNLSKQFSGSLETFLETYNPLASQDGYGGLSVENQEELDAARRKYGLLKLFLDEAENPSTRWLSNMAEMKVSPSVSIRKIGDHAALDYLKFELESTRAMTHAAYFSRGRVRRDFETIANPTDGFCALYANHREDTFSFSTHGEIDIQRVERFNIVPSERFSKAFGLQGIWESLRVNFNFKNLDEEPDNSMRMGELWCFRYGLEPKEFTRKDLADIMGEKIQFLNWSEEVLRFRGEKISERESATRLAQ